MSSRVPLRGGSAGEPIKTSQLPYFHDGVKAVELISKNTYGIRILPAFEYNYDTMTPKHPLSVVSYRDRDKVDPETQRPVFTDWYFPLKVHKMIGDGQRSFASPLIMEGKDIKDVDPLHNMWLLAKNSENPEWRSLTDKGKDEYNAPLRKYRIFYVVNGLMNYDNKMENRLVVMTGESLQQLKKKLNQRGGRGDTILDPEWEDYCFGDVTSPQHGLFATVKPAVFNDAGMKTATFFFGNQPQDDRPIGVQKYPIDVNAEWGQAFLNGRYNIPDFEKVTKVSLAEQILAFAVDDGYLPYGLIQEACGHKWNIPRQNAHPKHFTPPAGAAPPVSHDQAPAALMSSPGPSQPQTTSVRKFWMAPGGKVSGPYPENLVIAQVTAQGQDLQVCLEGMSQWQPASAFGILIPAPVAPLPSPAAPTPPPPPSAPSAFQPSAAAPLVTAPPPPSVASGAPPAPTTGAPPMPLATGMPPKPAGPMPTPPGGPTRPEPVQPPITAPPPPGASSAAPPPPVTQPTATQPMQPPAAATQPAPLNAAEVVEYKDLLGKWTANGGAGAQLISPELIARFSQLSERVSANNQQV